jgi:carbamoylphosphate synthase large subunit
MQAWYKSIINHVNYFIIMPHLPNENEINAATGFVVAVVSLVGLIIRSIEKARDKRKLKEAIREGTESLYEEYQDPNVN